MNKKYPNINSQATHAKKRLSTPKEKTDKTNLTTELYFLEFENGNTVEFIKE